MGITGNYCPVFLVTEESGAHSERKRPNEPKPAPLHTENVGVKASTTPAATICSAIARAASGCSASASQRPARAFLLLDLSTKARTSSSGRVYLLHVVVGPGISHNDARRVLGLVGGRDPQSQFHVLSRDVRTFRRDLGALSANAHGGLRTNQLRLKVLANQHKIATGTELSDAELRDYALDALDPAKGRARPRSSSRGSMQRSRASTRPVRQSSWNVQKRD